MTDPPGPTEWGEGPGVGPWEGPPPDDPRYDRELLGAGDSRNVVDAYRYWTREAIIADIDARRHPLHIAIENFGNDANIGSVVRTANAFAVHTVHIVGRRRWNRRGAMVTDRYQRLRHHDSTAELLRFAADAGLTVVAVDNVPGAARIEHASLPRDCLLIFGQEGPGITADATAGAQSTVSIAQFGSTRSINAAVAAGIAMHAWIRQHADLDRAVVTAGSSTPTADDEQQQRSHARRDGQAVGERRPSRGEQFVGLTGRQALGGMDRRSAASPAPGPPRPRGPPARRRRCGRPR